MAVKKNGGKAATKKVPPKKKNSAKQSGSKKAEKATASESLDEFQDTNKTGRSNGKHPADAITSKKVTITLVKINKDYEVIIGSKKLETDGSTTELPNESHKGRTAHPDLRDAFKRLRIHFALIHEYISIRPNFGIEDYNQENIEPFIVKGVSVSVKDSSDQFVITAQRKLKSGKFTPAQNTVPVMVDENEKTRYKYMDELVADVINLFDETKKYQSGEKVGELQQTALPFKDAEDEEEGNDETEGTAELPFSPSEDEEETVIPVTEEE
jgi:hypothetical protein